MFPSVLIVDDEPSILHSLGGILSDEGYEVLTASNGYEAMQTIAQASPDLVLLDVWMPGMDGIETLKEIRRDHPYLSVIIITGHGTIETAVKATKLGAYDFIEKPLSVEKVVLTINNALNFRRLEEENRYLRKKTLEKHSITGNSEAIRNVKRQIEIAAPTDAWVLIMGENGTGKELVARTIHQLSARSDAPMVEINCAATAPDSIETELFGREKSLHLEPAQRKRGKLEMSDKGTLFLDEVGDMPLETQAKILRVLQERKFRRVGGGRPLTVDVRVIAATNKNLEEEIEKGRFREDLYYRLNVIPIEVPPLRNRTEDLPLLCESFLKEFARDHAYPQKHITPEAVSLLQAYAWPGNVRELKNLMERLCLTGAGETIGEDDIPPLYRESQRRHDPGSPESLLAMESFDEARKAFERVYLQKKLSEHGSDLTETARAIGVDRGYLRRKVKAK